MQIKILLSVLILVGIVNASLMIKEDDKWIIVNTSQKLCLDKLRGVKNEQAIYGPEIFKNHSLITLNSNLAKDFTFELSSCFYNSIIENVHVTELEIPLDLMSKNGTKDLYFYKSAHSDIVTIYGNK